MNIYEKNIAKAGAEIDQKLQHFCDLFKEKGQEFVRSLFNETYIMKNILVGDDWSQDGLEIKEKWPFVCEFAKFGFSIVFEKFNEERTEKYEIDKNGHPADYDVENTNQKLEYLCQIFEEKGPNWTRDLLDKIHNYFPFMLLDQTFNKKLPFIHDLTKFGFIMSFEKFCKVKDGRTI